MSGSTTFAGIKYAEAADEVNKFPVNVSEPGAKTIDAYLEEHTLSYKTRAASFEAKSGELSECTKALTVTLPAATVNRLIGVINIPAVAGELVKITTSGGAFIIGDFITAASKTATITLVENQHVLLFASGTNWFIVAGEPAGGKSFGSVSVAGVAEGASSNDWTVVKLAGAGAYEIKWTVEKATIPYAMMVTPRQENKIACVLTPEKLKATVQIQNSSTLVATDALFSFVALGI